VSYPEKFVVNEGRIAGRSRTEAARGHPRLGYGRSFNVFADPFYDPYSRYGYYSGFGYRSRYGLGYYGGYGYGGYGFGGYGAPIIVVARRGSGADSGPTEGRVVRGRGYTSARGSGGSTGRSAQPRSSGSSRNAAPAARSAPARSSGSATRSAAPARRSPSSSPRSTGRRAQPRTNRGN